MNIPSIPTSVDPNVRQAINELKNRVAALQLATGTSTSQAVATTNNGISDAPSDGLPYVRRNGQWEILKILG